MARSFLVALALGLALHAGVALGADATSPAAAYPSKSIRFIVPYAAGGNPDTLARSIGSKLREAWGQPVVVDNRAGANGTIACETTAHSPSDGYTLLMGSVATHALNPALYRNLPYDPIKDFTPITQVGYTSLILVAHPSVQAGTVEELIALAKTKRLTYGSVGIGSAGHLAGELFKSLTGADLVHVPYKGMPAAVSDLLGGADLAHLCQHPGFASPRQSWQAEGDRRHRHEAVIHPARRARDRRGVARLRGHHVVGGVRAGRHAAAACRQAQ